MFSPALLSVMKKRDQLDYSSTALLSTAYRNASLSTFLSSLADVSAQANSCKSSSATNTNNTMSIYERSKFRRQQRELKLKQIEQEMMHGCTFAPATNSASRKTAKPAIQGRTKSVPRATQVLTQSKKNSHEKLSGSKVNASFSRKTGMPEFQGRPKSVPRATRVLAKSTKDSHQTPNGRNAASSKSDIKTRREDIKTRKSPMTPMSAGTDSTGSSRIEKMYKEGLDKAKSRPARTDKEEEALRRQRLEELNLKQCSFTPKMRWTAQSLSPRARYLSSTPRTAKSTPQAITPASQYTEHSPLRKVEKHVLTDMKKGDNYNTPRARTPASYTHRDTQTRVKTPASNGQTDIQVENRNPRERKRRDKPKPKSLFTSDTDEARIPRSRRKKEKRHSPSIRKAKTEGYSSSPRGPPCVYVYVSTPVREPAAVARRSETCGDSVGSETEYGSI